MKKYELICEMICEMSVAQSKEMREGEGGKFVRMGKESSYNRQVFPSGVRNLGAREAKLPRKKKGSVTDISLSPNCSSDPLLHLDSIAVTVPCAG